ncbi:MAG: SUMF1/EgtB/PvdO family nonheme iron enzyme, partial [bacterium]
MSPTKKSTPIVFISSTAEDLTTYRQAARDVAIRARFLPEMQEYFASQGKHPPLKECLKKVDSCDVLIVIVAYRYGWIPQDQPDEGQKSITWLECERARSNGKEVLAFLVDPRHDWSEHLKEEYRLIQALKEKRLTPEISSNVQLAVEKLEHFKSWINQSVVRTEFTTPQDLATKVLQSLYEWRERHANEFPTVTVEADPQLYLHWLHDECAHIDIRGLQVGTGKAHKFGIEELYIPLTTTGRDNLPQVRNLREVSEHTRRIELHQALRKQHVAIIADPGAGKTTFIRRIAFALCQSLMNIEPDAAQGRLGLTGTPLPIFIRLGELADFMQHCCDRNETDMPTQKNDPVWLSHFLARQSQSQNWGLTQDFFLDKFKSGNTIFLLDGLDEAPDRRVRETLSDLVTNGIKAYSRCQFVVTSRPQAYEGRAVLQDFQQFRIEPLEQNDMEGFLLRWSRALHHDSPARAEAHHNELIDALQARAEIRRMARNPVMLTALAVVHWNERRLPEQRADLYESIITWLLRSREQKPGRINVDKCSVMLQNLALAMQLNPQGRQVTVGRRWAAEAIQKEFPQQTDETRIAAAERFLAEEEVDSGIVVARGNQITFWHLTFQEFLTAKALGGKVETEQQKILINPDILHRPEWREVLLLFGGVLYNQGRDKIDGFFSAILDMATEPPAGSQPAGGLLADEARCVGLIGAMLRDLKPFSYELLDLRYQTMRDHVMAIFDKGKARTIEIKVRLEAADALGQAGDPRIEEDPRLWKERMITIPAGSFLMGAQKEDRNKPNYDLDARPSESPVHQVKLYEYKISPFPVTVCQYRRFIDDGGYENEDYWQAGGWNQFKQPEKWDEQIIYPTRPVVGVSWYEAMAYARWAGMELPTEAQWERAAKGKRKTYHQYPWGDDPPDGKITNSDHSGLGHPSPIGMFPDDCTSEGVMDMGGNVIEWCRDWKDVAYDERSIFYEKSNGGTDPLNDETGNWGKVGQMSYRVIRGGAWDDDIEYWFRCANR